MRTHCSFSLFIVIVILASSISGCITNDKKSSPTSEGIFEFSPPIVIDYSLQDLLNQSSSAIIDSKINSSITSEISAGMFYPIIFSNYSSLGPYMNHALWDEEYPIEVTRLIWDRVYFDDFGIPMVEYADGIKYVPTTAFHWGLLSYSKWVITGNYSFFEKAQKIALWAIENQSDNGGWNWYFDYNFSGGILGKMESGWSSAMTQGLGMSFMSRMYAATGDDRFKQSSLDALEPLKISVNDGGVKRMYDGNYSWYELYPTPYNGSFVLNGFVYALIGLHDNWVNLESKESKNLYEDGINSLEKMISLFDLGCASSYDLVHHSIRKSAPNVARKAIHNLHISQLSVINSLEENKFLEIQNRFFNYSIGECITSKNGAVNVHPQYNESYTKSSGSDSYSLFEDYNHSGLYMNHQNWNGGLWDRVVFDEFGIPMVQYPDGLKYVPTTAFHWGLVQYSKWIETQESVYFENASKVANWAVENQSHNGGWAWFFDHSFHGGVLGSMDSGWYGGMTQGLGMSFLVRMYNSTGNQSYMNAALNSTHLLTVNVSDGGVLRNYQNYTWYEEYPTPDSGSYVLNGYIYTLVGLYDLINEFKDSTSIELYQDGIISLSAMIGLFDLGCASSYDLVHHSVPGTAPNIAREDYHNLHINLLSVINVIENNSFQSVEDRWIDYANGFCFSSPNGANSS